MDKYSIRLITEDDALDVLNIYKPYVQNTIISFEYEAPEIEEYAQRIKLTTADFPWLVCLQNNQVIGYAYAGKYGQRKAYQWSVESSIYLCPEAQGKGIAKVLYETLFYLLRLQGYFNVYAAISVPNEASLNFHRALGFKMIGAFEKAGYKMGNWHDVHWLQLQLAEHIHNPPAPKKIAEIGTTIQFQDIMQAANKRLSKVI